MTNSINIQNARRILAGQFRALTSLANRWLDNPDQIYLPKFDDAVTRANAVAGFCAVAGIINSDAFTKLYTLTNRLGEAVADLEAAPRRAMQLMEPGDFARTKYLLSVAIDDLCRELTFAVD